MWIYSPHLNIIRLYLDHQHNQPEFSDMLRKGFGAKKSRNRFEIPYIISSHKFSIIQRAIITDCYLHQLEGKSIDDPKIIDVTDILKTLMNKIVLGMPQETKESFLKDKLEHIIQYGEKYKLFERMDDDKIRLICSGTTPRAVLKNIKEKFYDSYADELSRKLAEKEAMRRFIKDKGRIVPLTEFLN